MCTSKTMTFLLVAASAIFLTGLTAQGQVVWYVDDDAPSGGDGAAWATAYDDLQHALGAAIGGDEIRVAAGTYRPDGGSDDRFATFQLVNGVAIYGGYAGCGAPDPDERDVVAYETVLSGDLFGNDGPEFANNTENSYHVVTSSVCDATAVLDGFTITGGNADGPEAAEVGAGVFNDAGSPILKNCTITCNYAVRNGGGMMNWPDADPTLVNCTFAYNQAGGTGGMAIYQADAVLINCTFSRNVGGTGAGGLIAGQSGPTLTGCMFRENTSDTQGGGFKAWGGAAPTLTNCTFIGNSALFGAGMYSSAASPTLVGCSFMNNETTGTSGSSHGGGMSNVDSTPVITHCRFIGNRALAGGGIMNMDSTVVVANCMLSGNMAALWAGGGIQANGSILTMTNCTLSNNQAPNQTLGAGLYNTWGSTAMLNNCVLWGNHGLDGADEDAQIVNHEGARTGVSYSCVQQWNSGGTGNINDAPLLVNTNGPDGTPGTEDDDLRLGPGSPCIDAANNSVVPADTEDLDDDGNTTEPVPLDLAWAARFVNDPDTIDTGSGTPPIVDMGAYEFQVAPAVIAADIKPGSCPNLFNRMSRGMLPAALVGTLDFDATTIDIASILVARANGIGAGLAPFEGPPGPHSVFEDVATPFEGGPCECHDLGDDGIIDLLVHFKADNIVEALELEALPPGVLVELVISGNLLDGRPFTASDCIRLVPPGAPPGLVAIRSTIPDAWIDAYPLDLQLDDGGFADFERSYAQTSVITLVAPRMADGVRFAYWEVDGVPQARGRTAIDFEVAGDVMEAKAVYLNPGIQPVQGGPVEPIEMQPIGGGMQPTSR